MSEAWHLAIDFGTSNSAAAHTAPGTGSVETLALTHRSNLMPSAAYVDNDGSSMLTGDTALHTGRRDPLRLILSPKRFIDHETVQLGGDDIETRQVIGAVLSSIVERATQQHAGTGPTSVTLTHPEQWSAHALGNLVDAARSQGWAEGVDVRVISEPRAAAIHYAAQQSVRPGEHVAVYDFGGGTLDVAVLRAEESGDYRVIAARGDNSLGGRTIDNLVYRWVIEQVEHDDPDLADSLRQAPVSVMNAMEENIRQAKEMLSDTSSATITISTPSGDRDMMITRAQFNEIIAQPIERAREMTQAVLREAGVEDDSTQIYLTGGSSRIPYVHEQLAQVGNVVRLDDPKTVVARGALVATLGGFTAPAEGGGTARPQGGDGSNPFGAAAAGAAGAAAGGAAGAAAAGAASGTPDAEPAAAGAGNGGSPFGQPPQNQQAQQDQQASPFGQDAASPSSSASAASSAATAGNSGTDPVPSSHSSADSGGSRSKLPLLLGAGAAVILIGGGAIAWASGLFSGDDSEETTTAATDTETAGDSSSESTSDASASSADGAEPAGDSDGPFSAGDGSSMSFIPVTELVPGSDEYLPEEFTERATSCAVETREIDSQTFPWTGDSEFYPRNCPIGDEWDNPVDPSRPLLPPALYGGSEGADIVDALEGASEAEATELDSGDGQSYFVENNTGAAPRAMVWYPDPELLIMLEMGTDDGQSEAEEYLSEYGFL